MMSSSRHTLTGLSVATLFGEPITGVIIARTNRPALARWLVDAINGTLAGEIHQLKYLPLDATCRFFGRRHSRVAPWPDLIDPYRRSELPLGQVRGVINVLTSLTELGVV